ncbi:MAG: hypothetical protein R3C53_13425 [Pirellulaceae bacterium]
MRTHLKHRPSSKPGNRQTADMPPPWNYKSAKHNSERDKSVQRVAPCLSLACLIWLAGTASVVAIDEFEDVKTISKLPLSLREIEAEFSRSRRDACEIIPAGESLEITSFTKILTERDRRESQSKRLMPSSRRDLFSVGLEMDRTDRESLPTVSRGTIIEYLEQNYVSIQARVRRDLLDQKLYFHHRPLAMTAKFRGSRLTQGFESIVAQSIRDFHGLGLFMHEGDSRKKPESFRTLVLLFRTEILPPGKTRPRDVYEFAFVRGEEIAGGLELEPHVFVTSQDRTRLEYLRSNRRPSNPAKCSVLGNITVTDYDSSGLYPKKSATRSYRLDQRQAFAMEELDAYCRSRLLRGGLAENLTEVLDAIIAGEISVSAK